MVFFNEPTLTKCPSMTLGQGQSGAGYPQMAPIAHPRVAHGPLQGLSERRNRGTASQGLPHFELELLEGKGVLRRRKC